MFFERQRIDEAGYESIRLQKLLAAVLVVSFLGRALDMVLCVITKYWGWSFFVGILGLVVLIFGFYGAAARSRGLLAFYIIFATIWVVFRGVMLPFVLIRIVRVADCVAGNNCASDLHLGSASVTVVIIISAIETFLVYTVWFLMIYSCVVAHRLRRLLKREAVTVYEEAYIPPNVPYPTAYQAAAQYPPPITRQVV